MSSETGITIDFYIMNSQYGLKIAPFLQNTEHQITFIDSFSEELKSLDEQVRKQSKSSGYHNGVIAAALMFYAPSTLATQAIDPIELGEVWSVGGSEADNAVTLMNKSQRLGSELFRRMNGTLTEEQIETQKRENEAVRVVVVNIAKEHGKQWK